MTRVIPIPGTGCRYWYAQRCLYALQLNPGLNRHQFCTVLKSWEQRFDEHLLRSELFGLSAQTAGQIWARRMHQGLAQHWDCPEFYPGPDPDQELMCGHLLGEVCVLRLPFCLGRCRYFQCQPKE